MPVIRVDEKVYKALQSLVEEPFKETPNTVIEKLLEEKGVFKSEKSDLTKKVSWEDNMKNIFKSENLPLNFNSQREAMITIYKKFDKDKEKTVNAYAYLEKKGSVPRKSNSHNWTPLTYSKALFNDGIKKGWLG